MSNCSAVVEERPRPVSGIAHAEAARVLVGGSLPIHVQLDDPPVAAHGRAILFHGPGVGGDDGRWAAG
ncbi:MAG: hypothetical protein EBS51_11975 [Planctomycetia bacterium]|nr:hypothetical protein [Planctomycetia bacterium]